MKKFLLCVLAVLLFFAAVLGIYFIAHRVTIHSASMKVRWKTASVTVSNDTETFSFLDDITVSPDASYVVAYDSDLKYTVSNKIVKLYEGDNVFHIRVTNGKAQKTYMVTIRRRPLCTVTFDTKGTFVPPQKIEEGGFATPPNVPKIVRNGYTFDGWNWDFSTPITSYTTITAKWIPNVYSVTYNLNGGTLNGTNPSEYTPENTCELISPSMETDYDFVGWYLDNKRVTNLYGLYGDIELVAKWTPCISVSGNTVKGSEYCKHDTVNIPSEVNGVEIKSIQPSGFANFEHLKKVTIPNTVTTVGEKAFYECSALESVTIGEGVTSLGVFAFYKSHKLVEINFNAINCEDFVYEYPPFHCLGNMADGITITFGDKVKHIPAYFLSEYRENGWASFKVRSIIIGDGVTTIGDYAFKGSNFTSIKMGNNVTHIGTGAFWWCNQFTHIDLPATLKSVGENAFWYSSALDNVNYLGDIESWCAINFYDEASNPLSQGAYFCLNGTPVTDLVIPDSLESIPDRMFAGCQGINSITIGKNIKTIGSGAFSRIGEFERLNFLGNVAEWCKIGFYSIDSNPLVNAKKFYINGTLVENLIIPDSVTAIRPYAFPNYKGLESITIGKNVKSIGKSAFYECHRLVEVVNKSSLQITKGSEENGYIAEYALEVHTGKSKLVNKNGYSFYPFNGVNYLISYRGTDTALELPENFEGQSYVINKLAFYLNQNITSVNIPNMVTAIGANAFNGCGELTSITLPNSITSIEYNTFKLCTKLADITIPDSVTRIDDAAFLSCDSLRSVTIPNSVTSLGHSVFSDCNELRSVKLSDSLTKIESGTFYNCAKLLDITIPNSVKSIEGSAFSDCKWLTSIIIPDSVKSIGHSAFSGCTSLRNVVIGTGVQSIGSMAFYNCCTIMYLMYRGTEAQWSAISKGENWNKYFYNNEHKPIRYALIFNYKNE